MTIARKREREREREGRGTMKWSAILLWPLLDKDLLGRKRQEKKNKKEREKEK